MKGLPPRFGEIVKVDDETWLVIGKVDHSFVVNDLEINDFGTEDWLAPTTGYYVVMAWGVEGYSRGFVSQLSPHDLSDIDDA